MLRWPSEDHLHVDFIILFPARREGVRHPEKAPCARDSHYCRTFGLVALIALTGTEIDASLLESSTLATQEKASDAARRNFAESFGRVAEQAICRNLNVQPTLEIRPGYKFSVRADQDIIFRGIYRN